MGMNEEALEKLASKIIDRATEGPPKVQQAFVQGSLSQRNEPIARNPGEPETVEQKIFSRLSPREAKEVIFSIARRISEYEGNSLNFELTHAQLVARAYMEYAKEV